MSNVNLSKRKISRKFFKKFLRSCIMVSQSASAEPKFEINMYHSTPSSCSQPSTLSNIYAVSIRTYIWVVNLYIFQTPEDTSSPSKLEFLFLLDSSASICVLNLPTFTILADLPTFFNVQYLLLQIVISIFKLPIKMKFPYYLM